MADLHQEMQELSQQIAEFKKELGRVAGGIAELESVLGPFMARFQQEVLRYHEALVSVQREIADLRAMRGDRGAKGAGEISSPLDRFSEDYVSVEEQYQRTWKGKEVPKFAGAEGLPPASPKLKAYYAEVAASLHPDLVDAPAERERRRELMQKANQAYVRRDEISLHALASAQRERSSLPAIVDERVVEQLRDQVFALEELITRLEGQHFEMRYGTVAKIKAHADAAEANGQDLLQELSIEIQDKLRLAQERLAALKASY
jgi:hypothetical protein